MSDKIDVGYGFRGLKIGEQRRLEDEVLISPMWTDRVQWMKFRIGSFLDVQHEQAAPTRRRIDPGDGYELVPENERLPLDFDGTEDGMHWIPSRWETDASKNPTPAEVIRDRGHSEHRFSPVAFRRKKQEQLVPGYWEQLRQLVRPVWDGNLISKDARRQLVGHGLVARAAGFNFLTEAGVRKCVEKRFLTDGHSPKQPAAMGAGAIFVGDPRFGGKVEFTDASRNLTPQGAGDTAAGAAAGASSGMQGAEDTASAATGPKGVDAGANGSSGGFNVRPSDAASATAARRPKRGTVANAGGSSPMLFDGVRWRPAAAVLDECESLRGQVWQLGGEIKTLRGRIQESGVRSRNGEGAHRDGRGRVVIVNHVDFSTIDPELIKEAILRTMGDSGIVWLRGA